MMVLGSRRHEFCFAALLSYSCCSLWKSGPLVRSICHPLPFERHCTSRPPTRFLSEWIRPLRFIAFGIRRGWVGDVQIWLLYVIFISP
jgi:hypothetical protein